jgi:hypothetical protein
MRAVFQIAGGAEKMPKHCATCRKPLAQNVGKGRPTAYCSVACRRSKEYRLRAMEKLLARLYSKLSDQDLDLAGQLDPYPRDLRIRAELERQITECEAKMGELLAAGEEEC